MKKLPARAELEQGFDLQGLALPLLVLGGIWLMSRFGQGDGGGTGGVEEAPASAASVGGGVIGVSVSQEAVMGQVEKVVGSNLIVEVRFQPNTTRAGQTIAWPYYLIVRIGHNTIFGFRLPGNGGLPNFNDLSGDPVGFPWPSSQVNVVDRPGVIRMPTMRIPNDIDQLWDIHVQLRAQESGPDGQPNGVWFNLGPEEKTLGNGAFRIVAAAVSTDIGGSVSTVTVTQPLPGETLPLPGPPRRGLRLGRR